MTPRTLAAVAMGPLCLWVSVPHGHTQPIEVGVLNEQGKVYEAIFLSLIEGQALLRVVDQARRRLADPGDIYTAATHVGTANGDFYALATIRAPHEARLAALLCGPRAAPGMVDCLTLIRTDAAEGLTGITIPPFYVDEALTGLHGALAAACMVRGAAERVH